MLRQFLPRELGEGHHPANTIRIPTMTRKPQVILEQFVERWGVNFLERKEKGNLNNCRLYI